MRAVPKINEVEKTKYLEFKIKTTNYGSDNRQRILNLTKIKHRITRK